MSYAKLLGLKNISDYEVIRILAQNNEAIIGDTIIKIPDITQNGVSGDFGEYTPR